MDSDTFGPNGNVWIVKPDLTLFPAIEEFLSQSQDIYPDILDWWRTKVIPGLQANERFCFVSQTDGQLSSLAIVRRGIDAKLCTLRVHPRFQHLGLGHEMLRAVGTELIADGTSSIHFTMSEQTYDESVGFFVRYGARYEGCVVPPSARGTDELLFTLEANRLLENLNRA